MVMLNYVLGRYYIYFNIQFRNSKSGLMNQFVPQLMLGNPCCNSTNEPHYQPQFTCKTSTWIFSAQYFFEIIKNGAPEAHAATGAPPPSALFPPLGLHFPKLLYRFLHIVHALAIRRSISHGSWRTDVHYFQDGCQRGVDVGNWSQR